MYRNLLVCMMLAGAWISAPTPAQAQQNLAWLPDKGHGSVSIAYQQLHVQYHTDALGNKVVPGTIDNHIVSFALDYGLTDNLAITVRLPYKANRYNPRIPGAAHDPGRLDDDHGENLIDDGNYHAGWADWNVGLRYRWRTEPWALTPFISYGVPSRDYTTFAHSAAGTGQQRLEFGINAGHRFARPLHNLYFQGGYGYAIMQEVDHRRVNHSTVSLELGYFVTPRFTARMELVAQKTHNGLDFPQDYPFPRRGERFFHHDQNVRNDFVNIIAGGSYQLNDRYALFANYGHTLWGENAHLVDYSISLGISRNF